MLCTEDLFMVFFADISQIIPDVYGNYSPENNTLPYRWIGGTL